MIINNTHDGSAILYTHVYWDDFFSSEELEMIVGYCENKKLENGITQNEKNSFVYSIAFLVKLINYFVLM